MAYVKRDNDRAAGFSYLDGVPVKISEKYRAPRKITLPLSYQQRCPVELLTEEYDFSLERQVLEDSQARHKEKEAAERARSESIGTAIQEFTRLLHLETPDSSKPTSDTTTNWPWNDTNNPSHQPDSPNSTDSQKSPSRIDPRNQMPILTTIKANDILKPTKPSRCVVSDKPDVTMTSKLNLEDFESESSPFDSVALRSLDDMEELKRVLQGDDDHHQVLRQRREDTPYAPPYINGGSNVDPAYPSQEDTFPLYPNISSWHGQPPAADCPTAVFGAPYPVVVPGHAADGLAISTPDLLKELGAERDRRRNAQVPVVPMGTTAAADPTQEHWPSRTKLHESHPEMGPDALAVVKHITDMGFPKSRVIRAVQKLGADGKKVVEHLCSVQSLVEKGYKAEQAETALHLHDQSESRALQFLELVAQFRDLGFDEEIVKEALLRTNNDRDRALDFLVS